MRRTAANRTIQRKIVLRNRRAVACIVGQPLGEDAGMLAGNHEGGNVHPETLQIIYSLLGDGVGCACPKGCGGKAQLRQMSKHVPHRAAAARPIIAKRPFSLRDEDVVDNNRTDTSNARARAYGPRDRGHEPDSEFLITAP